MLPLPSKPRVFLSHSSINKPFIQRVYDDLTRCQISPWLDSIDIRHGQPWLDAIFQHGIAACDAIIVYLTEESLKSELVKKEIDAGIIAKLRDKQVAFLPYVSCDDIRPGLRPDLQALQSPAWNEANYSEVLPQVVAELWHSYVERVVVSVTAEERAKRLAAELELERAKKSHPTDIFSPSEERDFGFIWSALDRYEPIRMDRLVLSTNKMYRYECELYIASLVPLMLQCTGSEFRYYRIQRATEKAAASALPPLTEPTRVVNSELPDLTHELTMYGFLLSFVSTETAPTTDRLQTVMHVGYTEKYNRFRYWLAVKGQLPQAITLRCKTEMGAP